MSLSSDGDILAVGGPYDNSGVGATWIFLSDGTTYKQLDLKLVGNDASGSTYQGKTRPTCIMQSHIAGCILIDA